jgi:cell division septal protein FtsQ
MKMILKIIFVGILSWYTYISYIEFKKKSLFNIVKVEINVKNKKLVSDLIDSMESFKGKNILEIKEEEIREILLKDIRVKDIIIKKQMPDILVFGIEEKIPFTYVEYKGNIYIADDKGTLYGYMKESKKYNMPLFRISEEKDIREFIKLIKKIKYKGSISQVYRVKNGIALTVDNGMKIITDLDVNREKYEIVKKIYELEKNKKNEIEYIDLRFEDYIIKREEGDHR